MLRLTAIFIAICVIVIAASLGALAYLIFGLSGMESVLIGLIALSGLILTNMVVSRLQDRDLYGRKIDDLSNGIAELARQVADMTRRQIALESLQATRASSRNDVLAVEIGELGGLVKQLAETIAEHETRLAQLQFAPRVHEPVAPAPVVQLVPEPVAPAPVAPPVHTAEVPAPVAATASAGPFKGKSHEEIAAIIREAIEDNRIDLHLQPVLTLPQRRVRFYEAMTRMRLNDGTLVLPADFLADAEKAGLLPRIDNVQLFRCVQVLRRLMLQNRDIGLFCNVAAATLSDPGVFRQFYDFLDANRALAPALTLEFTQSALRGLGPIEQESLAALSSLGFRFSMDRVTDLRMGPRDLAEMGVRFVKVPAELLLREGSSSSDIHAADLSDLLHRHGISLIAERIETEGMVVDLLDYDIRFGQGFLFSAPRPVRAEALQAGAPAAPAMPAAALSSQTGQTPQRPAQSAGGFVVRPAV